MDGAFQTGVSPVSVRPPNCTSTRRLAGGQLSTLDSGKSLAISQLYSFSPGKFPVAGGSVMPELHSMSAAQWEASRDRSPAGRSAKGRLPWAVLFAELSQPSDPSCSRRPWRKPDSQNPGGSTRFCDCCLLAWGTWKVQSRGLFLRPIKSTPCPSAQAHASGPTALPLLHYFPILNEVRTQRVTRIRAPTVTGVSFSSCCSKVGCYSQCHSLEGDLLFSIGD